jgi:hypothetical protein
MMVGDIFEIDVVGVFERGIPNHERIVLCANQALNLGQYGMMIGLRAENGSAFPIKDNLLWFGDGMVAKGDWIFLYTGPGEAQTTNLPNSQESLYSIHWGRKQTILDSPDVVPILFRVDAVNIPNQAPDLSIEKEA